MDRPDIEIGSLWHQPSSGHKYHIVFVYPDQVTVCRTDSKLEEPFPVDQFVGPDEDRINDNIYGRRLVKIAPARKTSRPGGLVRVTNLIDGSYEETPIGSDGYMVVVGPDRYISHEQRYSNGTVIVTIKMRNDEAQAD